MCLACLLLFASPGCKKSGETAARSDEVAQLEAEQQAAEQAAAEAAAKPAAPVSRMNDDLYIEITARSALIQDKYKENLDQAQKEVDALYDKFGVTIKEYDDFRAKQTPKHRGELEKKVVDFMQKVASEYK
jgi:hypothetical protein